MHCVKSVRLRSFSGPYFPACWLNTGKDGPEKLRIGTILVAYEQCTESVFVTISAVWVVIMNCIFYFNLSRSLFINWHTLDAMSLFRGIILAWAPFYKWSVKTYRWDIPFLWSNSNEMYISFVSHTCTTDLTCKYSYVISRTYVFMTFSLLRSFILRGKTYFGANSNFFLQLQYFFSKVNVNIKTCW